MLITRVKKFISQHLPQTSRIIVGLSGGADSMALLLSLRHADCELIAAHCNFHLRGEESERDRRHCEEICSKLGIELLIKDFDVAAQRAATSESLEMACRTLRYAWWDELIAAGTGDYIAVGHHCEDNVETFFLNLLRGSGIAGLKGMLPVNGHVIRPLLECSRANIEQFVIASGYDWVNDSTNSENEYKRNRLRNIILPAIEQEFPGATAAMVKSLGVLRSNFALYRDLVANRFKLYVTADVDINLSGLMASEPEAGAILHETLPSLGFTHSQIDDLCECAIKGASGQLFDTPCGHYIYERGILSKMPVDSIPEEEVNFRTSRFHISRISAQTFRDEIANNKANRNVIYLDASAFDGNPRWSTRTWRQGDRLEPFGMKGSRLVSDLFNDAKYSTAKKLATPLLFRDGKLLWVAGLRASRHFKVTDSSTEVIKITYN